MKKPKVSNSLKVRGYLKMCGISQTDVAKLAGVNRHTAHVVFGGHGNSLNVRTAAIELVRLTDPKVARKIEKLWPKGTKLAA